MRTAYGNLRAILVICMEFIVVIIALYTEVVYWFLFNNNAYNMEQVSNIGFITVHGLKEGHIKPYTDIEFRLTKYQTYIIIKSWYKSLQLINDETITLLTKIKHIKQMALKIFHNRIKSRLYYKKA